MVRVSASEFRRSFGRTLAETRDGPVEITRRNRTVAYLVSPEMFEMLRRQRRNLLPVGDAGEVVDGTPLGSAGAAAVWRRYDASEITVVVASELEHFRGRIDQAFLFGSMVPGNIHRTDNIDLVIVGELTIFDLGETLESLESRIGREVHLSVFTKESWDRLAGNHFIREILSEKRIVLIGAD